jgi:hypothetical protein
MHKLCTANNALRDTTYVVHSAIRKGGGDGARQTESIHHRQSCQVPHILLIFVRRTPPTYALFLPSLPTRGWYMSIDLAQRRNRMETLCTIATRKLSQAIKHCIRKLANESSGLPCPERLFPSWEQRSHNETEGVMNDFFSPSA